ncbi:MAG: hypothetical protein MGG37_20560 [Trichodesmium sp. MAG_R01]|nr:hypothetical protein [Trichodesmium sp. MAG_R01]
MSGASLLKKLSPIIANSIFVLRATEYPAKFFQGVSIQPDIIFFSWLGNSFFVFCRETVPPTEAGGNKIRSFFFYPLEIRSY